MQIPLSLGRLHFVGIGGIGMSGIAEVMHNLGYAVSGSDMAENANVLRLRGLGIDVKIGHLAENVAGAAVVVVSTAVKRENPEVAAARAALIPVVRRAEMLAEIMRLKWSIAVGGTHGKTTTTSLVAQMLDSAKMDPTVINGGIINAYGTNARLGQGDWVVAEADESDGTFVKLPATIAIVTNIDPEHMDHYGTFDALRDAFRTFVQNIPFYGFAALCLDHPEVQALIGRIEDRRIITYGFSPQAEIRAVKAQPGPDGYDLTVEISPRTGNKRQIPDIHLRMHGDHNVKNALAAIAVAVSVVSLKPAPGMTSPSLMITVITLWKSQRSLKRHDKQPPTTLSRSFSRTAIHGCMICSKISAPVSTMQTACWSRRSIPQAKTLLKAQTGTI